MNIWDIYRTIFACLCKILVQYEREVIFCDMMKCHDQLWRFQKFRRSAWVKISPVARMVVSCRRMVGIGGFTACGGVSFRPKCLYVSKIGFHGDLHTGRIVAYVDHMQATDIWYMCHACSIWSIAGQISKYNHIDIYRYLLAYSQFFDYMLCNAYIDTVSEYIDMHQYIVLLYQYTVLSTSILTLCQYISLPQ